MASKKEEKFLELMRKRLARAVKADEENRRNGIEDLKFLNGDQWDADVRQARKRRSRPVLQINLLPKFVDQMVGEERHNRPRIKVRPANSQGDVQLAKIREGIIANIEYQSNAQAIYDSAFTSMVECGYGAWRVLTRYTEDNPFLQEIYLESVPNPFAVYLDPDAKDACWADAKWGFVVRKMSKDEFQEEFPKGKLPSEGPKAADGVTDEHWYVDGERITVVEYFLREGRETVMCQMADGAVLTLAEAEQMQQDWDALYGAVIDLRVEAAKAALEAPEGQMPASGGMQPPAPQQAPMAGMPAPPSPTPMGGMSPQPPPRKPETPDRPLIVRQRRVDTPVINHYIASALEILEGPTEFPGSYIPLVLAVGRVRNIEGKKHVRGLIRDAKDPQRLINYWNTSAAEVIALQPKAPWVGTARQFEGYEDDYMAANQENFPFLKYNADPEAQGPPQRQAPGQPPMAMFQQIARAEENLKSVVGLFNADMGDAGPERTGAAVTARQKPGDVATFTFIDNLTRAIAHGGRIINEMIPTIYDSQRDVRLRHLDETETFVPINTTVGSAIKAIKNNPAPYQGMDLLHLQKLAGAQGPMARFNDITAGKYSVVVTTGPSYATARQESATQLLQLAQAMPQQMALAADLIVQNMDFRDAEELANRLRKTLPPGMAKPRPGEPVTPPPPNPQLLQKQADIELKKMKAETEKTKQEVEKLKLMKEMATATPQVQQQFSLAKTPQPQ